MTDEKFAQLVEAALADIETRWPEKIKNVAVVIEEDLPTKDRQKLGLAVDEDLLGLYEGIPQTERDTHYSLVLPDKITIFKQPILRQAKTTKDIRHQVYQTLWHELAHHLGYDEEAVAKKEEERFNP